MTRPLRRAGFRDALATVATAVSAVGTLTGDGRPHTVTVGSLCSLSLHPPLVLFCLDIGGRSHPVFSRATRFAVSVLDADQEAIARTLAGPGAARASVPLSVVDGLPVVRGALTHLWCTTVAAVPAGDHTIFIGEVDDAATRPGDPLVHHQRAFHRLAALDRTMTLVPRTGS